MIYEYISAAFPSVNAWGCGCMCVHAKVCNLTHILFRICLRVDSYPECYYLFMLSFSSLFPIFSRTIWKRRIQNYFLFYIFLAALLPAMIAIGCILCQDIPQTTRAVCGSGWHEYVLRRY